MDVVFLPCEMGTDPVPVFLAAVILFHVANALICLNSGFFLWFLAASASRFRMVMRFRSACFWVFDQERDD